jgi:DNA-3-methyladenine glycosylase I
MKNNMKTPPAPALTQKPIRHADGRKRCAWAGLDPLYVAYHDEEWGVPEWDGRALFEKLILDGFQAGLSWITILKKRPAFRAAFDDFNPEKIARYTPRKIEQLMANAGIVRHRGKIENTITSARAYLAIESTQGFAPYIWSFVDGQPQQSNRRAGSPVPTISAWSQALAKDLRSKGFGFCGPTIIYAFGQAVGMVNDHALGCHCHKKCLALSAAPFAPSAPRTPRGTKARRLQESH